MDYRAVRLVREDAANAWNRRRDVTFDCDDAKRIVEVIDELEAAERERDEARAERDAWKAKAEARPDITPQDAHLYAKDHPRSVGPVEVRVHDALRAHASKAVR